MKRFTLENLKYTFQLLLGKISEVTEATQTTVNEIYDNIDTIEEELDNSVQSVDVGATTTGEAGTQASVSNSGTTKAVVLDFIIPKGDKGEQGEQGEQGIQGEKGDKGDTGETGATGAAGADGKDGADGAAATISIGTVTTGDAGSNATVTNSGTSNAAVFDFTIPQGAKGDTGDKGDKGDTGETGATGATGAAGADGAAATIEVGTVTTGEAGSSASITNSGTTSAAVFDFVIPKGDKGDDAVADLSNYLPLSGGTMTGTIYQQNLTIDDGNQKIACVQLFDEGSSNGSEMVIGANGNTFIGSGESYRNLRTDFQENGAGDGEAYAATSERFYLTSDTNMYFYSNANTISARLGIVYDTNGVFRPLVTGTRSLGSASYRWDTAYINTVTGDLSGNATTATTATYLGSDTVGSASRPIYLDNGTAKAITATVGSGTKPIYISSGTFTVCTGNAGSGVIPTYLSSGETVASTSTVGGAAKPMYLNGGTMTACSSTVGSGTKPVYMNSGTITASTSTVGDSATPVYMNSGTITACSYGFGSDVTESDIDTIFATISPSGYPDDDDDDDSKVAPGPEIVDPDNEDDGNTGDDNPDNTGGDDNGDDDDKKVAPGIEEPEPDDDDGSDGDDNPDGGENPDDDGDDGDDDGNTPLEPGVIIPNDDGDGDDEPDDDNSGSGDNDNPMIGEDTIIGEQTPDSNED